MKYKVLKKFTKPDFPKSKEFFEEGVWVEESELEGKNIPGLVDSGFLRPSTKKVKKEEPVVEESEPVVEEPVVEDNSE